MVVSRARDRRLASGGGYSCIQKASHCSARGRTVVWLGNGSAETGMKVGCARSGARRREID